MTDDQSKSPDRQKVVRLAGESQRVNDPQLHDEEPWDEGNGPSSSFPHEKLDAYRVALQMTAVARRVAASVGRGNRNVVDHLLRSAANVVLLLAEGANRRGSGEKRQRFVESRGECGEVAAAADLLCVMDLASSVDVQELKRLASRVSAMLTGLIGRHS